MKKLFFAAMIVISFTACKKEKTSSNNNCGTVSSRMVGSCDVNGCSVDVTVTYPDGTSGSNVYFLPLNSTQYAVGSQYCK